MNNYGNSCRMAEEKIVDYTWDSLSAEEREVVERHIHVCSLCQLRFQNWSSLGLKAGSTPTDAENDDPDKLVPRSLQARLRRHVLRIGVSRRMRAGRRWLAAGLVAAVAMVMVTGLFAMRGEQPWQDEMLASNPSVSTQHFSLLQSPETVRYEAEPVSPFRASGAAYVKSSSNEMLIMVKGLLPVEKNVYQVWLYSPHTGEKAGTLQVGPTTAHFYFRGSMLEQADRIVISMEPQGDHVQPMGPGAMTVKLK